jgi:hypothetical protein
MPASTVTSRTFRLTAAISSLCLAKALCSRSLLKRKTGEVRWEVLQSQDLHTGAHLRQGEWDILLSSDAKLNEAEARLIAKAPEMYVLLRQLLAGQPVMTQVGHLINGLELSMEKGKP